MTTLFMRGLRCERLAANRISERDFLSETLRLLGLELWTLDPCSAAVHGAIEHAS